MHEAQRAGAVEPSAFAQPAWEQLTRRIQSGDREAMQQLYDVFSRGVRFLIFRHLGPDDLDDKVHDVFVVITQAICDGELREPNRLMGYVHTVVRRLIAGYIDRAVGLRRRRAEYETTDTVCDSRPDPECEAMHRQRIEIARKVLRSIPRRDREVLVRFYFCEESPEQICRALKLTYTQFRLIKSRAKHRFGELGKQRLRAKEQGARNKEQE